MLLGCTQVALGTALMQKGWATSHRPRPRVVFLNPGEAVERGTGTHWQLVSHFMAAAARRLEIDLQVLYAERDHLLMLRQTEEVARRREAPDYVVIVNEKMAAEHMLQTLARSSAKVLVIHNDLTHEQRSRIGNERGALSNWIGTLSANAERGGYRLMKYLCRLHGPGQVRVIGITGDPSTPVSLERANGVQAFLLESSCGLTLQLAYSDWSMADGHEKARVLLARYPDANVIWAANDTMTLGAMQAAKEAKARVLVGGIGALPRAVASVIAGDIAAMMAGDYFIGAWAMVLLYDYHHGVDFAYYGGARQKLDFLRVVHRGNAARFEQAIFKQREMPDFTQYSKFRHPRADGYEFDLRQQLNLIRE